MEPASRREPFERASPEEGELQGESRVRVLEVGAGELRDAAQALTHGVPVQVEIARDGVQASVKPKIRIKRADQLGVLLAVGERAKDPIREVADVALGAAEHEGVRAEVIEHRD